MDQWWEHVMNWCWWWIDSVYPGTKKERNGSRDFRGQRRRVIRTALWGSSNLWKVRWVTFHKVPTFIHCNRVFSSFWKSKNQGYFSDTILLFWKHYSHTLFIPLLSTCFPIHLTLQVMLPPVSCLEVWSPGFFFFFSTNLNRTVGILGKAQAVFSVCGPLIEG